MKLRKPSKPLPRPVTAEYNANRLQQYQQIERDASILDVVEIVGELPLRVFERGAIPETHLGPSCNPRFHEMATIVELNRLRKLLNEARPFRPRANDTHLTPENIEKLWQFINSDLPNQATEWGSPGIAFRSPNRSVALGIRSHDAKFE